jgi:hypothetical protein
VTKPSKYRYLRVVWVFDTDKVNFQASAQDDLRQPRLYILGEKNIKLAIRSKRRSLVSSENSTTKLYSFKSHITLEKCGERNPHYAGRWLKASPDAELKIQQRQPDASLEKEYCALNVPEMEYFSTLSSMHLGNMMPFLSFLAAVIGLWDD